MPDRSYWDVDKVAAIHALGGLGVEASEEAIEAMAQRFSEHRVWAARWAADRAHAKILQELEAAAMENFPHRDDEWTRGYGFAEQRIMTMFPAELVEPSPPAARTKGQILRSMVRQAKSTSATMG